MDAPHLLTDSRFATFLDRGTYVTEARTAVQSLLGGLSKKQALKLLDDNDVPCSEVSSVSDVMDDPHFFERGTLFPMRSQAFEEDLPGIASGFPVIFSGGPLPESKGAPLLGMQNAEIFGTLLKMNKEKLHSLEVDGVI